MCTTCSMLPNHQSLLMVTITIFVLLLMEILMNNVDHVFCLFVFFFHFFFSLNFSIPPKFIFFIFYMLPILYKTLTKSMIQLELAGVFLLSQSMYFCFMYVPYLFFNYALYIFVHIFTGVEMLCLFVYQLFIDLSCVFICNLDIFDNG